MSATSPTDAELNRRIAQRIADYAEQERLARARGTFQKARCRPGALQARILEDLRREALTARQVCERLGIQAYKQVVHSIAGLVARGLAMRDGEAWRAADESPGGAQ